MWTSGSCQKSTKGIDCGQDKQPHIKVKKIIGQVKIQKNMCMTVKSGNESIGLDDSINLNASTF